MRGVGDHRDWAESATKLRSYQLLIVVSRDLVLPVGRLGEFGFPKGRYVYTGSARRGMEARIRRHLIPGKRRHWHIDYLLAEPDVRVTAVERHREEECALNQRGPGAPIIPGFGASDCRSGCGSHLKYLGAS
jgi:Uri superfamily endonuclease